MYLVRKKGIECPGCKAFIDSSIIKQGKGVGVISCPSCGRRLKLKVHSKNPGADRPKQKILDPRATVPIDELIKDERSKSDRDTVPSEFLTEEETFDKSFSDGEVVAGRYKIVRLVAKGGMGEVYEAFDTLLGVKVALKSVLPSLSSNEEVVARIKREVQLARKISHPNVCRIYDIGTHIKVSKSGSKVKTIFVTMEFLEGETLYDYINRKGRLSVKEALPIVEQMVRALDAAHKENIVHRDFKSSNVMLTKDSDGALKVKVTDFGLAAPAAKGDNELDNITTTLGDSFIGSPAYIAPEQLESGTSSARSDIYSLGVVIYEMVTGRLPFEGDSPFQTALMRLTAAPVLPSTFVKDLPKKWEKLILKCLNRNEDKRFSSVTEVLEYLDDEKKGKYGVLNKLSGLRKIANIKLSGFNAFVIGTVLFLLFVTFLTWFFRTASYTPVVAIAPFSVEENKKWLATAIQDLFVEYLRGRGYSVSNPEEVTRIVRNFKGSFSETAISKLVDYIGADAVVYGKVDYLNDNNIVVSFYSVRVDENGEIVLDESKQIKTSLKSLENDLLKVAEEVFGSIGKEKIYFEDIEYYKALSYMHEGNYAKAYRIFERVYAGKSKNVKVALSFAKLLYLMGYKTKALNVLNSIDIGSLEEDEETKARFEALLALVQQDYKKAVETYKKLLEMRPDDRSLRWEVVNLLLDLGEVTEAEFYLQSLEDEKSYIYKLLHAQLFVVKGEPLKAITRLTSVLEDAKKKGMSFVEARARYLLGICYRLTGEYLKAQKNVERAYEIFSEINDVEAKMRTNFLLANIMAEQGDLRASDNLLYSLEREAFISGNKELLLQIFNSRAVIKRRVGDTKKAVYFYNKAIRLSRELENRIAETFASINLGALYLMRGDVDSAKRLLEKVEELYSELKSNKLLKGEIGYLDAVIKFKSGELEKALELSNKSIAIFKEIGTVVGEVKALLLLSDIYLSLGKLDKAEQILSKVEEIENEKNIGKLFLKNRRLLSKAELLYWAGNIINSKELLEKIADKVKSNYDSYIYSKSRLLLCKILLEEGDVVSAEAILDELENLVKEAYYRELLALLYSLSSWSKAVRGDIESADLYKQKAIDIASELPNEIVSIDVALNTSEASIVLKKDGEAWLRLVNAARMAKRIGAKGRELISWARVLAMGRSMYGKEPSLEKKEIVAISDSLGMGIAKMYVLGDLPVVNKLENSENL